jgi:hypothetical protein
MNQTELIREHLKRNGRINTVEAIAYYGCLNLSGRITEIRSSLPSVITIRTEKVSVKIKYRTGRRTVMANRYVLEKR